MVAKFVISTAILALLSIMTTPAHSQCARCPSGVRYTSGGSSSYHQPQYETTVTRHESQPVYYYPNEQRYSHSAPSQVVYQSGQPSYQYYESQPAVQYHTRRVISEPYPYSSQVQTTRYYTQSQPSQVVYREYNTQGYSPCSGSSSGASGVRSPCSGSY